MNARLTDAFPSSEDDFPGNSRSVLFPFLYNMRIWPSNDEGCPDFELLGVPRHQISLRLCLSLCDYVSKTPNCPRHSSVIIWLHNFHFCFPIRRVVPWRFLHPSTGVATESPNVKFHLNKFRHHSFSLMIFILFHKKCIESYLVYIPLHTLTPTQSSVELKYDYCCGPPIGRHRYGESPSL